MSDASENLTPAAPVAAVPPPAPKPGFWARAANWSMILLSVVTFISAAASLYNRIFPAPPEASCDASNVTDTVSSLIKQRTGKDVAAVSNVETISKATDRAVCRLAVRLNDETRGTVDYGVTLEGTQLMVRINRAR